MKAKFKIQGLDCSACAAELQEELEKLPGVQEVTVDFIQQTVHAELENATVLQAMKDVCNHFEEVKVVEEKKDASFKIEGLDCANCARELQEEIEKVEGVVSAQVDFVQQKVFVVMEGPVLSEVKSICNHFEDVRVIEEKRKKESPYRKHRKTIALIVSSAVLYLIAIVLFEVYQLDFGDWSFSDATSAAPFIASFVLFLASYIIVGYPVLISTAKNIRKGKIFDENFLMTLASVGAMIIGEMVEGTAVMLLYQIGELLQSIAVESSRDSISSLMDLKAETATLVDGDDYRTVDPESLKAGDILLIKNGEKVPVDAVLVEGASVFDTKSLTGEALPKDRAVGDELLAGYINTGSVVKAKVTRSYENSTVAKILDLVENSTAKKAEPEKFITRFAKYYTPVVCAIAAVIAVVVPLILSLIDGNWGYNFVQWIYKALILLVISCPCALIISVPLTYFGGVGACAREGILVKGTTYLDILPSIRVAAFDKTGTLTEGSFHIVAVHSENSQLTLQIAAAAESGSNHPIARAFEVVESPYRAEHIEEISGKGLKCIIDGIEYSVGNEALMHESGVQFRPLESLATIIYVSRGKQLLGAVEIDDSIKGETYEAIERFRNAGVEQLVMLTGDTEARAESVAKALHLDKAYGGLLPNEKLQKAEELKKTGALLYVGDGINDAPVMVTADCAVSMGKLGSDAAIEASDIVLLTDSLAEIPDAIRIARKTKRIVFQNILFSIVCKVLFMVLGILNLIPLWVAVFADVGVMLLAVVNSLRMRMKLKRK